MFTQPNASATEVRRFLWASLFSLIVLFTGMAWTWRIGQDSNRLYHGLYHEQESLAGLRSALVRAGRAQK